MKMRNGQLSALDWFMLIVGIGVLSLAETYKDTKIINVQNTEKYKIYYDNNVTNTTKAYLTWKIQYEADLKIKKIQEAQNGNN